MDTQKSIALLNKAAADELAAVHQYMYFHFHLDDQGFGPLSTLFRVTAIQEMGHVERLAERILFLGGDVEMAVAEPVEKITDAVEILSKAARMERQSAADYNKAAIECAANEDSVSKQMFEALVGDEERHFDQFHLQMSTSSASALVISLCNRSRQRHRLRVRRHSRCAGRAPCRSCRIAKRAGEMVRTQRALWRSFRDQRSFRQKNGMIRIYPRHRVIRGGDHSGLPNARSCLQPLQQPVLMQGVDSIQGIVKPEVNAAI